MANVSQVNPVNTAQLTRKQVSFAFFSLNCNSPHMETTSDRKRLGPNNFSSYSCDLIVSCHTSILECYIPWILLGWQFL